MGKAEDAGQPALVDESQLTLNAGGKLVRHEQESAIKFARACIGWSLDRLTNAGAGPAVSSGGVRRARGVAGEEDAGECAGGAQDQDCALV